MNRLLSPLHDKGESAASIYMGFLEGASLNDNLPLIKKLLNSEELVDVSKKNSDLIAWNELVETQAPFLLSRYMTEEIKNTYFFKSKN